MSTKVEPSNTSSPKISFAVKKGFLIPKNKLSGSLVPNFRGGKKGGTNDVVDEESKKQTQRKTKWGPDLTQDASVKKTRALAYQMRVDQITEQLKSGFLDPEDNQDISVAAQDPSFEPSVKQKSERLELERREAIGEILKLNSSYKPPSDYKPLLKEAKVPVPIKEHPGYNFIGIIFGPSSESLKQLEKETGAKVRVYGTKANTREKAEITSSDANEAHGAYEEVYVHVSADTYEKVDAAVALIELLIKPASINQATVSTTATPVSDDNMNIGDQTQVTSAPSTISAIGVNPEFQQPITGPPQVPPQPQFQPYPGPWFSQGPPQPPINPPNPPSFYGQRPVPQRPFIPQGQFGHPAPPPPPSSMGFTPVSMPPNPSLGQPFAPPHGPHPVPPTPAAFTNMPRHQTPFAQPMQSSTPPPPPPPLQSRTPSFAPMQSPPLMNQNPHRPNSDSFSFPPQRPQNHLPSQAGPRPMMQQQNQPFRPVLQNPSPQAILEAILMPLLNANRTQFPPFHENTNLGPQRGPRNNNMFPVPPNSHGPHMGPRNLDGPFPPRPGNYMHPQHNFPPTNRPQSNFARNAQFRGNAMRPNSGHGDKQVYDPFSPSG